jgi:hypothetical protein
LVHIAPDNKNLSSRQNAIDPGKFRQYLHLNNSRHRRASSFENSRLHDLSYPQLFPTPVALGLKAVFLVTTVIGLTRLWPAILADTGATVLVTLNALRLLRLPHSHPSLEETRN